METQQQEDLQATGARIPKKHVLVCWEEYVSGREQIQLAAVH